MLINFIYIGSGLIELGAQFIHGGSNSNPIYKLMNSLNQIDPKPCILHKNLKF